MAFAQLTYRESLRDIETCLRAVQPTLYHAGLRGRVSRSTLADANETRDWRLDADFGRLYTLTQGLAFFVIRGKRGLDYARRISRPVDKTTGLRRDPPIVRCGPKTAQVYPAPLRRISDVDPDTGKRLVFLTTVNAVKTQIWIAISVSVLVAILKKELPLPRSLSEILQILSIP